MYSIFDRRWMHRQRFLFLSSFFLIALTLWAQAPQGYYAGAKGKKAKALKTALYSIITSHTTRSYDNLWDDFKKTDVRDDGKIWDMYSNATSYVPGGSAQGKNYSKEGDSYNREHSFPKSWFNDAKPMYTDLFHLYPTDGYVNNRRSNYPYGETAGETYQSKGGFSKLGKSTLPDYSGTVFEPADEYKGDFARSYFYMATCYENHISSWSSPMLSGDSYPAFSTWALEMLLRWAAQDPVSEKEVARNNAVYGIQKNRNPFIDFPGLEQYVWGSMVGVAFDPDNYNGGGSGEQPDAPAAPVFSLPSGSVVEAGTVVTIAASDEGATIYYRVNDDVWQTSASPATVTILSAMTLTAYTFAHGLKSEEVTATYSLVGGLPVGPRLYSLVTSPSDLVSGDRYLIVCPSKNVALGEYGNNVRSSVSVTFDDASKTALTTATSTSSSLPFELVGREEEAGYWSFFDPASAAYLALLSSDNKLHNDASVNEKSLWTIDVTATGTATISNRHYDTRSIKYNASSPRFACYTSSQQPVALYRYAVPSSVVAVSVTHGAQPVQVYDLAGRLVRQATTASEALEALPTGCYIIGGRKVWVVR